MSLLNPLWLAALVPWAGLALWLLSGRRERATVPFVELWRDQNDPKTRATWRFQPPAACLVFALVAMLAAILAASGPVVFRKQFFGPITLVIDRGATMAVVPDRIKQAADALESEFRAGTCSVVSVPGASREFQTLADSLRWAVTEGACGVPTPDALTETVRDALITTKGPVIVVSDQRLGINGARIVQVPPPLISRDRILNVAARTTPRAQLMVTVAGRAGSENAVVRIRSDGNEITRRVALDAGATGKSFFFDLESPGPTISVLLDAGPPVALDQRAWLARERCFPAIEVAADAPVELQWMASVYAKHRPSGPGSASVSIVSAGAPAGA
ncbi:MAG: hypothetical protein ACREJC_11095, partial [Tepidisphaeraceae bacterium]